MKIFRQPGRINLAPILLSCSLSVLLIGCSLHRPQTTLIEGGVKFVLHAPRARKVAVVGDFNHWDAGKDILEGPDEQGVWSKVILLPKGRYEYLFLIDQKEWVSDPSALSSDDGLGGTNSVILFQ
jgi:1,4-alpha-glucan branching enzyme